MARLHLLLALAWGLLAVPTVLWWSESVLWVALVGLYNVAASHLAAYAGCHAEDRLVRKLQRMRREKDA